MPHRITWVACMRREIFEILGSKISKEVAALPISRKPVNMTAVGLAGNARAQ